MNARRPPPLAPPSPELIDRLAAIVGAANAIMEPALQARYLTEWRDRYTGRTPVVLRPGSKEEVSRVLALLDAARVGVVPQAGNTGLVGGQIPSNSGAEVVLSVERLAKIRGIDPAGTSIVAEAGVTLAAVQEAARGVRRLFPMSLASEGSARVGGLLATNAGGTQVLAYGSARSLAFGLEVVLADGRIWNGLRTLKKDNTGYDLRDLVIGSEGTLGVITAAALKLFPEPRERAVAFVSVASLDTMLTLFRLVEARAGLALTAFELLPGRGLSFVLKHMPGTRAPVVEGAPWYALIEISEGFEGRARGMLEEALHDASERSIVAHAVVANSLRQAEDLWRVREAMSEAQKYEGGSIKHDVSVPVPLIPAFITRANEAVEKLCPGARPVPFGHFGDGNVHYNVSQPTGMDKAQYLALWEEMQAVVHGIVHDMGGSISAEHGIGQMKRDELARVKGAVELDMMRAIKHALDPNGILNPGKVL